MLLKTVSVLILGILIFSTCYADSASGDIVKNCDYTDRPSIPNGRKATEAEMIEAQKAMKAFMEYGNAYLECLTEVEQSWGSDATEEQKATVVIFYNKVVDDMEEIAALFNSAVRAFKGKHK